MSEFAQTRFLEGVSKLVPSIQKDALQRDAQIAFPQAEFTALAERGLLTATLPESCGGLGLGHGAQGAAGLLRLFILLGQASLPVARLFEAHVNALQLIERYGTAQMAETAARDAAQGHLFALWVTDPFDAKLAMKPLGENFVLQGGKAFCSGAGRATRALITAALDTETRMLIVPLEPGARVLPSPIKLGGMRAAITGSVDFSGMVVATDALLGADGDYLREPVFSAGAWRGSAAALGGLTALVELHRNELRSRRRDADPHQRARFGQLLIALETANLWMREAALRGCLEDAPPEEIVAYINLARLAVETACLDALRLTQRSLGLGAFIAGSQAELLCRDLATYLRQPAPDETLDKAAGYYFNAPLRSGADLDLSREDGGADAGAE
jgi:alkylation response protein AidB-like acyl-CoA dehydrogenase